MLICVGFTAATGWGRGGLVVLEVVVHVKESKQPVSDGRHPPKDLRTPLQRRSLIALGTSQTSQTLVSDGIIDVL